MKNFLLGHFLFCSVSFLAQTSNVGGPVSWSFDQDVDIMHIPHFQLSKSKIEKQIFFLGHPAEEVDSSDILNI